MSEQFKKRVDEYMEAWNRKAMDECKRMDTTGVLWTVGMNKEKITEEEMRILEMFANEKVMEVFAKYEVYA